MTRDEIENLLDGILDKELENSDVPTSSDWDKIESKFKTQFPLEFKTFIELMSVYSFPGDILNVSNGKTNGNDTIEFTYDYELKQGRWREEMIPFYGVGNGDYFCLHSVGSQNTGVYYYSHEEKEIVKETNSFEDWLKQLPDFLR